MLPSSHRVSTQKATEIVKSRGVAKHSEFFSIRAITESPETESRFGVVVSKKTAKTAVARNEMRRKVYEAIRQALPQVQKGYASLIFIKKDIRALSKEQCRTELRKLLSSAGIIQ